MAFNLTKPIWALICLHDVTQESVVVLTDHFADAFVCQNVVQVYDVVATLWHLKVWRWHHFVREIMCKKRDILMFKLHFRCSLGWNQVKYARITITHVCFIALTLAVSLRRWLNTWPNDLVFKQLPRDRDLKTCMIPILVTEILQVNWIITPIIYLVFEKNDLFIYLIENKCLHIHILLFSFYIPPPLLQDPWPCVQLLRAERHAPCQWNLATYQDEPAAPATQW